MLEGSFNNLKYSANLLRALRRTRYAASESNSRFISLLKSGHKYVCMCIRNLEIVVLLFW